MTCRFRNGLVAGALCWSLFLVPLLTSGTFAADETKGKWVQLFNGKDLSGWKVKIKGHALGDNFGKTFRVEDGVLKVGYDAYKGFGRKFGHLFYEKPKQPPPSILRERPAAKPLGGGAKGRGPETVTPMRMTLAISPFASVCAIRRNSRS